MTKYNHYAKELDEAFKEAREIYIKAYTEYSGTKKAFEELPHMSGMIPFEAAERRKKAKYDFEIAELKFNEAKKQYGRISTIAVLNFADSLKQRLQKTE